MFINTKACGYTRDGQQTARGRFLVLCKPKAWEDRNMPMRAFAISNVRMKQFGHFMMANAKWRGFKITLSGTYGDDGSPCPVERAVYDLATLVPQELVDAWNKGCGWNSAGCEAPAMKEWALKTFPARAPKHGKIT